MSKQFEGKILRIGVIRGGRIVEERLLRKWSDVTIGYGSKNTFVVSNQNLPKSTRLFEAHGGGYLLCFDETMTGRVSLAARVTPLQELRDNKVAQHKGEQWRVPLDPESRGKVVFGDVTLLFQFVTPPAVVSRPQLPAAVKGGWMRRLDVPLLGILALSFVFHTGFAGGLHFWWEKSGKYQVRPVRTANETFNTLVVEIQSARKEKKPQEEKKPSGEEEEKAAEETKKKEKVAEKKPKPKPKPKPQVEQAKPPQKEVPQKTAAKLKKEQQEEKYQKSLEKVRD